MNTLSKSLFHLKKNLRKFPKLVKLRKKIWRFTQSRKKTKFNVIQYFPAFIPNSSGSYDARTILTLNTINQIFPLIDQTLSSLQSQKYVEKDIAELISTEKQQNLADDLKRKFDEYGSDKASVHNYYYLYAFLFSKRKKVKTILEIGLGTNNESIVSNMSAFGSPGASLRAFRDVLPDAIIYGADIDKDILFSENQIKTFYVDQTSSESFDELEAKISGEIDLIIDDGLHSPDANIRTLNFGLNKVSINGWIVIEDIGSQAKPIWQVFGNILPDNFQTYLFTSLSGALIFAVNRLS